MRKRPGGGYAPFPPDLLFFLCERPARTGGETLLTDGCAIAERLSERASAFARSAVVEYDYRVPRMRDIPQIHIKLVPTRNAPTGAGQMATPLVAAAISNAVFQLTGARLRQQPMLAGRVLQALAQSTTRAA